MKKLLLLLVTAITITLAGCQEISDLIRIQQENKDTTSMHVDLSINTEMELEDVDTELDIDLSSLLGINMAMDINNGITHTFSTVDFLGIEITVEQFSQYEEGVRYNYTNVFGIWTKSIATDEGFENLSFDSSAFIKALRGSFEIIEPITVDDEELVQMRLTMTVEDMQNIFGMNVQDEEATDEETTEMLAKEISFVLGYNREDFLIRRVALDFTDIMKELDSELSVEMFEIVLLISNHNNVEEIIIPEEALNAPLITEDE